MDKLFHLLVTQQIGGYQFKNPKLLEQAFIRRSYTEENGGQNNEVLEFIGDKALDLAVVRYLIKKNSNEYFFNDPMNMWNTWYDPKEFESTLDEGELTKLKQRLVEKKTLAHRIDELGFSRFLVTGKGDELKKITQEKSVKEDLFEAIIGAVAIDSNWDMEVIQSVVEIMLCPDSILQNQEEADYVGLIYEWEAEKNGLVPWFQYEREGESLFILTYKKNPDYVYQTERMQGNLSCIKYHCALKLLDSLPIFIGYGESKNEARKAVCKLAYNYLKEKDMLFTIKDEIENPNLEEAIGQLEILARRGYFSIPTYSAEESHDENGNPIWNVKCKIEEVKRTFAVVDSSKKFAKKKAAFKMLDYVLEGGK